MNFVAETHPLLTGGGKQQRTATTSLTQTGTDKGSLSRTKNIRPAGKRAASSNGTPSSDIIPAKRVKKKSGDYYPSSSNY